MLMQKATMSAVLLVSLAGRARADLLFTLSPPTQQSQPGGQVTFGGQLINAGSTDVYINGDVSSGNTPFFIVDDSPFLFGAPNFLAPGDAWSGDLFVVAVASTAPSDNLTGEFTILGGSDGEAADTIGAQSFAITISPSSVPEPSSLIAGAALMLWVGCLLGSRPRKVAA